MIQYTDNQGAEKWMSLGTFSQVDDIVMKADNPDHTALSEEDIQDIYDNSDEICRVWGSLEECRAYEAGLSDVDWGKNFVTNTSAMHQLIYGDLAVDIKAEIDA